MCKELSVEYEGDSLLGEQCALVGLTLFHSDRVNVRRHLIPLTNLQQAAKVI